MVVGNGFRRLQLCRRGPQAGDLGAGLVLAYGVAGKDGAYSFLKIGGFLRADG